MLFRQRGFQAAIAIAIVFIINAIPLQAALNIPIPQNTETTKEETRLIVNSEYDFNYYTSGLGDNKIKSFYRSELPKLGWREKKVVNELNLAGLKIPSSLSNMLEQNLVFEKGTDTLVINFIPEALSPKGKTQFTVAVGKAINAEEIKEGENYMPELLARPQKDVFPVYPGASLISLSEPEGSIKATYFAKGDIEVVAGFYKNKMLNYGWLLINDVPAYKADVPVAKKEDISAYCPSCAGKGEMSTGSIENWMAELYFTNQNQDTCNIVLSQATGIKEIIGNMNMETTLILVDYEEKRD